MKTGKQPAATRLARRETSAQLRSTCSCPENEEDAALLDESEAAVPAAFSAKERASVTFGPQHAGLYPLSTPEKLERPAHAAAVTAVTFGPDGTSLASIGKDRVLRVCDASSGQVLWQNADLPGVGP